MIEDYLSKYVADTRDFNKIKFAQMFPHYLNIYGSTVKVRRLQRETTRSTLPDYDQLINQVYGKVASKDMHSVGDKNFIEFETKLILHQLNGAKLHVNASEQVMTYHTDKVLDLGDEIVYRFMGKQFDLHVTDINHYDDILYEFILQPIREHVNTK
jgi:hypothetical protein